MSRKDKFTPWYRGFKNNVNIKENSDNRFITRGIHKEIKKDTFEITELPIGMWTSKFADFIDDLKSDRKLKKVSNYSTPNNVKFIVTESDSFNCNDVI